MAKAVKELGKMAKIDEEEAKRVRENFDAVTAQIPLEEEEVQNIHKIFEVYIENAPHMYSLYCTQGIQEIRDRAILDSKTRELLMVAILMAMGNTKGVIYHSSTAKQQGVTDEELWEVFFMVCYQQSKCFLADMSEGITKALEVAPIKGSYSLRLK